MKRIASVLGLLAALCLLSPAAPADIINSVAACGSAGAVNVPIATGYSSATVEITNTWSATGIAFSAAQTTTYVPLPVTPLPSGPRVSQTAVNGQWAMSVANLRNLCIAGVGTWNSGSANVTVTLSTAPFIPAGNTGAVSGSVTVTCANSASTVNGTWVTGFSVYKQIFWYVSVAQSTGGTTNLYLQNEDTSLSVPVDRWSSTQAAAGTGDFNYAFSLASQQIQAQTALGTTNGTYNAVLAVGTVLQGPWGDQFRLSCVTGSSTSAGHLETAYFIAFP